MCINISASLLAKGYDSGPREKGDPNRKPWLAKMIFQVHKKDELFMWQIIAKGILLKDLYKR